MTILTSIDVVSFKSGENSSPNNQQSQPPLTSPTAAMASDLRPALIARPPLAGYPHHDSNRGDDDNNNDGVGDVNDNLHSDERGGERVCEDEMVVVGR
ncbi:hypothetical protein ACLOJK_010620 [Asimina triloba]